MLRHELKSIRNRILEIVQEAEKGYLGKTDQDPPSACSLESTIVDFSPDFLDDSNELDDG
jgi:hypothetical protein